jgi:UDP-2,3-diacylglucosamine pyrophosphatase LpxH
MTNNGNPQERVDTLIMSDLHLKSRLSRTKSIEGILAHFVCRQMVLGGDVVDDDKDDENTFRALDLWADEHGVVHIRKGEKIELADDRFVIMFQLREWTRQGCRIYYVWGNHDPNSAKRYASLIGAKVCDEYCWQYNGKQIRVIHGDQFDVYSQKHPWISNISFEIYYWTRFVLGSYADRLARFFKRFFKGHDKAVKCVALYAFRYGRRRHDDCIICGHTHHTEFRWKKSKWRKNILYCNAGCVDATPATCITVCPKGIRIHYFDESGKKVTEETPPQ